MVQFLPSTTNMGQNSSVPKPGRRKSFTRSFPRRRSQQPRSSGGGGNLSHTFTVVDHDHDADKVELLNINQATEEELMTLHGVNREIARSIIEHRKAIVRFRKVEDLALVRGIGADKLEVIRPEITVSSRKGHHQSCASSRAQSYDSLKSTDSRLTIKSNRLMVNVNKSSVFELQCVNGITQEIAAAIVHYREKRGPFEKVEDLIKIKNIDHIRLNNINRYLTVESIEPDLLTTTTTGELNNGARPGILTNGYYDFKSNGYCGGGVVNGGPSLKLSYRSSNNNGLLPSSSSLLDIFELLSAYSPRPILEEMYKYERNGEPAVRIACWNLHDFSMEKASNLGVKEVICCTILENGWSIIAVQDVLHVSALRLICDELNKPTLRRINEWKHKTHCWHFCMLDVNASHLGFIYDSDAVVDIDLISLSDGPPDIKDCEILIGGFRVGELNLQLFNVKLNDGIVPNFHLFNEKIKDLISETDMLLLLGDYSHSSAPTDNWLNIDGLQTMLPYNNNNNNNNNNAAKPQPDTSSNNNYHRQNISNIFNNCKIQAQLTGINGVTVQGLTHLAIPNGWDWGGLVSPYCPVWIELFTTINSGTAM